MFDDCLLFTIVLLRCIVYHTLHCWCVGVKFKDLSANILSLLRTINVVAIFVSLSSSASFSFFSSRSFRILIPSLQSQAKFSPERAKECIDWIEEVKPPPPPPYFIFRNTFCSSRGTALPSQFAPFCPTFNCWGKLTIMLNLLLKVIGSKLEMEVKDQVDFGTVLKDGAVLCQSVQSPPQSSQQYFTFTSSLYLLFLVT